MNFIHINTACNIGLMIASDKLNAFCSNHAKWLEMDKKEREHLAVCAECNPDLLISQLWPLAKVTEE